MILERLLYNLRSQGLRVGPAEWLDFLRGLEAGLAEDMDQLYWFSRAILVHDEGGYDAFDVAFSATFKDIDLPPQLKDALVEWLSQAREGNPAVPVPPGFNSLEEMLAELKKRLEQQKGRHDGGPHWVGTGGTSPFGNSGRNDQGIRIGGTGGGRGAVQVAEERRWGAYRTDLTLDIRDFQVALGMLRRLQREGREQLSIERTIQRTADNGGEIELVNERERVNKIKLVLLMDVGGSMDPHSALVSRLFSAAKDMKIFKSLESWYFHNCPYTWLYKDFRTYERKATAEVIASLSPEHRLIWVGDASMAPWELTSSAGGFGDQGPTGLDWLKRFAAKTRHAVWLNPDPPQYWDHPTVSAIRATFPMYPLTVEGLKNAVSRLRRTAAG